MTILVQSKPFVRLSEAKDLWDELSLIADEAGEYCEKFCDFYKQYPVESRVNVCCLFGESIWVLIEDVPPAYADRAFFFWHYELEFRPKGVELAIFPVSFTLPEDTQVINPFAKMARQVMKLFEPSNSDSTT